MTVRTIIFGLCGFVACMVGVFLLGMHFPAKKERKKAKFGTMDFILVVVGIALTVFTVEMIRIYREFGSEPTTLETCVFGALSGECGIMGWIKTTKEKYKEREENESQEEEPVDGETDDDFPTCDL